MLVGGSGDRNLSPIGAHETGIEEMVSRLRSLLRFSMESRGPKVFERPGQKRSEALVDRCKALFQRCDSEGFGTLTFEDIRRMVRCDLKIAERLVTDAQLVEIFSSIDDDRDGYLQFNEFLEFVQQPSRRGAVSKEVVLKQVARSVRLALHRHHVGLQTLEVSFQRHFEDGAGNEVNAGELCPEELIRFFRRVLDVSKHECSDKNLRVAFTALDTDGSGTINVSEFMDFLKYCSRETKESPLPTRVKGLLGGMRGELPMRRTDGVSLPFCSQSREAPVASRMGASKTPFFKQGLCEAGQHPLGIHPRQTRPRSRPMTQVSMPVLQTAPSEGAPAPRTGSPPPVGGDPVRLPGTLGSTGGYKMLKGAEALNQVEERLLAAGIDVRGNYHRLRWSSYSSPRRRPAAPFPWPTLKPMAFGATTTATTTLPESAGSAAELPPSPQEQTHSPAAEVGAS